MRLLLESFRVLLTPLTYVHVGHAEDGQQGKQNREVNFGQRLNRYQCNFSISPCIIAVRRPLLQVYVMSDVGVVF